MKKLQLKSIFFSLVALMTIAVFMTSCGKDNNVITEELEISNVDLTARLIADDAFVSSVEIINEIDQDFSTFIQDNAAAIERDPAVLNTYVENYTTYQDQLNDLSATIIKNHPELFQKNQEDRNAIISDAKSQLTMTTGARNSCVAACDAQAASLDSAAYSDYLFSLQACVNNGGNYNVCNATNYSLYLEAHAIIVSIRNSCVANC